MPVAGALGVHGFAVGVVLAEVADDRAVDGGSEEGGGLESFEGLAGVVFVWGIAFPGVGGGDDSGDIEEGVLGAHFDGLDVSPDVRISSGSVGVVLRLG